MLKKNRKKIIITLITILIILLIICLFVKIKKEKEKQEFLQAEKQRVLQYTKIEDFKSIEEVLIYLNITFLNIENSNIENIQYKISVKNLETPNLENENYYSNLIQYSASCLKYKNFYIEDKNQNINILVICNQQEEQVSEFYINNEANYFEKLKNNKNINSYTKKDITKITNISEELQNIISNNWNTANINIGTKDGIYRNYDIYFDEGYEIKKINGKIFNIVFTEKYKKNIVENLKVNSKEEEIVKTLGEPGFKANGILGYKTEKIYIFFENGQVSIYPIINYETDQIANIIEKNTKNEINLVETIAQIKNVWIDYDIYNYEEKNLSLQYTLKGICINTSGSKKGIILYNNYSGNITNNITLKQVINKENNLPENVYFVDEDLVFVQEQKRLNSLDDYTEHRNYATNNILNTSNKYKINIDPYTNQVRFVSINKENINTELRENISYGIWYDDFNFIYSVKYRGIFIYNVKTNTYSSIKQGNEEFKLLKIENKVLYYDNNNVEIKI